MQFLKSLEDEKTKEKIFDYFHVPKKYFVDIETEILNEFPNHENPKAKITAISIANEKNQVIVLGLKSLNKKQIKTINKKINDYFKNLNQKFVFSFKKFKNEYLMLNAFFSEYAKKMPLWFSMTRYPLLFAIISTFL